MAIIRCPECGKEISDRAAACPNCGNPILEVKDIINNKELFNKKDFDKNELSTVNVKKKITSQKKIVFIVVVIAVIIFGVIANQNVLYGEDKAAYDLLVKYSSNFENPSSVRLCSGTYVCVKLEDGTKTEMLTCKISATNGFGGTTTKYYNIVSTLGIVPMDDVSESRELYDDTKALNIKKINKKLKKALQY